jgi:outer membrane immunogenic protein
MKKLLVAGFIAAALCGAPAFAADMPVKATPQVWNWTGFYLGAEGGLDVGQTRHFNESTLGHSDNGWISGGTIGGTYGYNVQAGQWVYGLEGDISWAGSFKDKISSHSTFCGGAPGLNDCLTDLRWLGTDRVRAGYLSTPSNLIYLTGGVAYGNVRAGIVPPACCDTEDHTRAGWTVGGGIESKLAAPNWTMKLEYLWVDLGNKTNYAKVTAPTANESVSLKENIFRLGFNYKFGG